MTKKTRVRKSQTRNVAQLERLNDIALRALRLEAPLALSRGERLWLGQLLQDIARDRDVRGQFHEPVAHRPAEDSQFWIALDYRLAVGAGGNAAARTADAWRTKGRRLSPARVKRISAEQREAVNHVLAAIADRDALREVVAWHRPTASK